MSFSGLCIGGPCAGMHVTCAGQRYIATLPPPAPGFRNPSMADVMRLRVKTFTYKWVVGIDLGWENLTNFWVPEDCDVRWAIEQLLATYETCHAE